MPAQPVARKRFSERQVLETLAWQGIFIKCHRCSKPFFERTDGSLSDAIFASIQGLRVMHMARKPEREHLHEYSLDGPDEPSNCRYSCSECHSIITNGTKATSAGSSKHRIAKIKRILADKPSRRPMAKTGRKIPSRPWPARKGLG